MSKYVKIGVGVFFLLLILGLLYYFFKSPSSYKYVSADSLKKIKDGTHGTFGAVAAGPAYDAACAALKSATGVTNVWDYVSTNTEGGTTESLAIGWCKGANVAFNAANVNEFASDISAYVTSTGAHPHWKHTVGDLLK